MRTHVAELASCPKIPTHRSICRRVMGVTFIVSMALSAAIGCGGVRNTAAQSASSRTVPRDQSHDLSPARPPVASSLPASRTSCPADTANTRVSSEDVTSGAALVFSTSERVADLRARVAEWPTPERLKNTDSHLDKIHNGVRVVFVAGDKNAVASLQQSVHEEARAIARRCGLVLAPPAENDSAPEQSEETKRNNPAHPDTQRSRGKRPETTGTHRAVDQGHKNEPKKGDTSAKPKGDGKPKDQSKPDDSGKPPAQPKPGDKPKVPRLPGVRPDPVAPQIGSLKSFPAPWTIRRPESSGRDSTGTAARGHNLRRSGGGKR